MRKKKEIKLEKLTENVTYRIIDGTIYLFLSSNSISTQELNVVYKKISLIIEDNDLSYVNISGKRLEDNKSYFLDLGFSLSYYDINKLNELYSGTSDKKLYKCYGIMTKSDFFSKLNEVKNDFEQNIVKVENKKSYGFVNSMLLLFFGLVLLCFFCVQGAIYLVR